MTFGRKRFSMHGVITFTLCMLTQSIVAQTGSSDSYQQKIIDKLRTSIKEADCTKAYHKIYKQIYLKEFSKNAALEGELCDCYVQKGISLFNSNDLKHALSLVDSAKQIATTVGTSDLERRIYLQFSFLNDSALHWAMSNDVYRIRKAIDIYAAFENSAWESNAMMGYCYWRLGDNTTAENYYKKGVSRREPLAGWYYAQLLAKIRYQTSLHQRIELYQLASPNFDVADSLGTEYVRAHRIVDAYKQFEKSKTDYSKYQRAYLLLDPQNKPTLTQYADVDPIDLLTEAAPTYPEAAYYLGMLYRYRSKSKSDALNTKGWDYIRQAAEKGHNKAKELIKNKDEYEK